MFTSPLRGCGEVQLHSEVMPTEKQGTERKGPTSEASMLTIEHNKGQSS